VQQLSRSENEDAAIEAVVGIDCSKARPGEPKDQDIIQMTLTDLGAAFVNQRLRDE
jgi:hypothetical protein